MEAKRIKGLAEGKIDVSALELIGKSGKHYKATMLTAGRLATWEKAWLKAQYNMNPSIVFSIALQAIEALKKNNVFDCSVALYKITEGVARIADGKPHYMLELMSCFLNYEGEDLSKLDENDIQEKINDLSEYSADDLFMLAGLWMPAFIIDYEESKKAISEKQEVLKNLKKE